MKISTAKASPALQRFLGEHVKRVEVLTPEEPPAAPPEVLSPPPPPPLALPAASEEKPAERKAAHVQDLMQSDEWIGNLCRHLIDTEKWLLEHGIKNPARLAPTSDPSIKGLWERFRQQANCERFQAQVEKYSKLYANGKLEAEISAGRVGELKQAFLKAIRKIQEPYRSTLVHHFCEGLSVADLVAKQEIAGWIIRERLVAALGLLDQQLEAALGKQKVRSYVLLSRL